MTLWLHLQCFSPPTLFIRPALFPKIRSRITSEQSLLTVARVWTAHRSWKIKPLFYLLALFSTCALAGLKSLSGDWSAFRLFCSVSMFPFLSYFLSPCSCIVQWKKKMWLSFLLPDYIPFRWFPPASPPPLFVSLSLHFHLCTSKWEIQFLFVFFYKKQKQKGFLSTFLTPQLLRNPHKPLMSYHYSDHLN